MKVDWSLERLSHCLCRRTNNWIKIEKEEDEDGRRMQSETKGGRWTDRGERRARQGGKQAAETDRLAENQWPETEGAIRRRGWRRRKYKNWGNTQKAFQSGQEEIETNRTNKQVDKTKRKQNESEAQK